MSQRARGAVNLAMQNMSVRGGSGILEIQNRRIVCSQRRKSVLSTSKECRDIRFQEFHNSRAQKSRIPDAQVPERGKSAIDIHQMSKYHISRIPEFRNIVIREFHNLIIPEFRSPWIPEFQNSGAMESQTRRCPDMAKSYTGKPQNPKISDSQTSRGH